MKTTNMKMNNANMIKVSLLVIFTSLLPFANVSAQKKQLYYPNSDAPIEVGDSIRINPDSLHYETGERKVRWVYDKVHIIRQVSSKYHPDAVLLRGINSWIYANSILAENEAKKLPPEPVYTSFDASIDYGTSYEWNGTTYNQAGEYTQKLTATSGADSIVTLNLTVLPPKPVYTSIDVTIEFGQIHTWNALTYDTTGVYTQSFVAQNGADSIVTLNLTVLPEPEPQPQPYQVNRLTVGVRGAFASTMAQPSKVPLGFDVLLDLQYAHYWAADQDKIRLGIMTGLSAGYMSTTRNQAWDETYVAKTDDGDIEYHITADNIEETSHQLQLEVPLMFSLITAKGLFFNVGPRFLLPAYTPYKQVITNGNVIATDLETGVVIPNNPVYGQLSAEQVNQKGKGNQQFDLTMTLGFELGYEFKLSSGSSIGVGAFLNYGVYSMYSNKPLGSAIDLTAPSKQEDKNAVVNVESLTNAYTEKMGHLDAGVKVSFNMDFIK